MSEQPDPAPVPADPPPLRSSHTSTFPQILDHFGVSVLVTTYQAGHLIILRPDGPVLNTHFRMFQRPMGLALAPNRLAIGCEVEIKEFHSVPAVVPQLEPPGKHDAAFLPRTAYATGDVQIHEMAWVSGELWFANTLFSCLCTRSEYYSFQPRWRPSFISQLAPEDRCHLNGLAVVDGRIKYVTALGETDERGGWRKNKRDGGILIDVESQQIIARGLSMPHSPRWYRDRLWLLNSGAGGLGWIDTATGRYEQIVELPGFTRGLSFAGPYAFVGLSQVRESAIFSGIAIAERPASERCCGVWVVDIDARQVVAFVRFEDAVQEIFAVEVLAGSRYPEVVLDNRSILANTYVLPDDVVDGMEQVSGFRQATLK
ncbi:MAG: TIGR03032 family protein [Planctomycetes bacterium]|nr:TIGR03032 family protein [Planctomycetota bacterium]